MPNAAPYRNSPIAFEIYFQCRYTLTTYNIFNLTSIHLDTLNKRSLQETVSMYLSDKNDEEKIFLL